MHRRRNTASVDSATAGVTTPAVDVSTKGENVRDPRQNSDTVVYDRDGNILRVIPTRKRSSSKANKLDNARKLHALKQLKKGN